MFISQVGFLDSGLDKRRNVGDIVGLGRQESLTARIAPMTIALARRLVLKLPERQRLEALVRASSTPQALAFRCRLILRAAEPDAPSNSQIAAELNCERQSVGLWRNRYRQHGLAGLQDAPRSGRPRSFSPLGTPRRARARYQPTRRARLSRDPLERG